MLNKNELKQKLITTGYFVDNKYLDSYLDLIYEHEVDPAHYSENHHVIPVALYKLNNDGCDRRKAEKFARTDSDNFEVLLLYKDHCLAHYLLYFCTTGKLKNNMQCVVRRLIAMVDTLSTRPTITEKLPSEEELAQMQQWRDHIQQDKDSQYWTAEEVAFLTENYPTKGSKFCSEYLCRTRQSVCAKAFLLDLPCSYTKTNGRAWTTEELNILKTYYSLPNGTKICCELLDRPKYRIVSQANSLGLKSARTFSQREIDYLLKHYSEYGPAACAAHLGRTYNSIISWASTHGIKYQVRKEN